MSLCLEISKQLLYNILIVELFLKWSNYDKAGKRYLFGD